MNLQGRLCKDLIGQVTIIYEMTVANDEALSALEVAVKTERNILTGLRRRMIEQHISSGRQG